MKKCKDVKKVLGDCDESDYVQALTHTVYYSSSEEPLDPFSQRSSQKLYKHSRSNIFRYSHALPTGGIHTTALSARPILLSHTHRPRATTDAMLKSACHDMLILYGLLFKHAVLRLCDPKITETS